MSNYFSIQVFSFDVDSDASSVEMDFLHYTTNGYWEFPKEIDTQTIDVNYVFYGPTKPTTTSRKGYQFGKDDVNALDVYRQIKN